MKKNLFLLAFIFIGVTSIFAENVKLKTDARVAFPIDFGEKQSDYFFVSPSFNVKAEIPIFKDFGATVSGECLFGDFKNKENLKLKLGKYQFYSLFAGVFYSVNLSESFSIIPNLEAGYSYTEMKLESGTKHYDSLFSLRASVDFEKKLNDNWALFAVTSFGYYKIYCPLSLGIGAAYIF